MTSTVKCKFWGPSRAAVLRVMNEVRDLYAPGVSMSDVKDSDQGGVHGFLTLYVEEAGR